LYSHLIRGKYIHNTWHHTVMEHVSAKYALIL